jgi:hypothetical protein
MLGIAMTEDKPDEARRHAREAMSNWSQSGFHIQHWYAMWWEAANELYAGTGGQALARLDRDAVALRKSMLLHAEMIRGMTTYLRGAAVIASIESAPDSRVERVAEARRIARRLEKESAVWAPVFSTFVRAAAENAAGDRGVAVSRLREGLRHAEATDMHPHAWAARYHLGRALGGDEGRELVAQAERSMRDEGVRSPERMAAYLVPGRWS